IECEITGREKTRYSIWKKMQRKNVSFEQLSDIMAFRIVVDNVGECYHALGVLHAAYPVVPGRFKDYISTPKPNGYRSLHTTVLGPEKQRIEIQIRTLEMHQEADLGVAAHWAYKDGSKKNDIKDVTQYRWLRELLDILEQEQRPEDFLEHTKLELFQDKVFVFSPKGDLIELPSGATPVDFAYAVHSDVGDKCVGAKVNGKITPLNTKLNNGDQVEVITSKTQTPSPAWERFVVTGKARSHIKRFIRQQQRSEYITLGQAMLKKIFAQEEYEFTEKAVAGVTKKLRVDEADDIYANIGSGHFSARDVFKTIFPAHKTEIARPPVHEFKDTASKKRDKDVAVPIKGLIPGMAMHFARCCHPLPGDRIVGIVSTGKGVTIHTIDCETLETFADTPERWLDVSWGDGPDSPESHVGRLNVTFENKPGGLGTVSTVIGKNGGNILNLKITNRSLDFWDIILDVYVNDTKHLNNIIAALRATPEITSVDRAKGR
ncbi:MAG: RelA/SpoT AH/RIS domain-containing protein, partial [Pseudomonadota bacterium]